MVLRNLTQYDLPAPSRFFHGDLPQYHLSELRGPDNGIYASLQQAGPR